MTKLSSYAVLNKVVHEKLYKYKGLKLILSILQRNLQFSLLFEALLALPLWKRTSIGVSIRISVGCFDILGERLGMMEKFIMERYMLGLCVLDRGGTLSRLHLQIICKIYISSLATLNQKIKKLWAGSRLKEIGKELAQELEKRRSSSSQFDKQQSFPLEKNVASMCKRFSKELMFILIHISNFFPNHVFKITCCMLSANKICIFVYCMVHQVF